MNSKETEVETTVEENNNDATEKWDIVAWNYM